MKTLLFFTCLFPLMCFSQVRNEYLTQIPSNLLTYPISKHDLTYFGEYPFIQIKDSVTGLRTTTKNPKHFGQKKETIEITHGPGDNFPITHRSYGLSYYSIALADMSSPIPFTLDSLADGPYVCYYENVAYEDGDTLKFIDKSVYAIFFLKNNLLHGEASVFYPNGLLLERFLYENGRKNGDFFFQKVDIPDLCKKEYSDKNIETESGTFLNDEIEGEYINYSSYQWDDKRWESKTISHHKDRKKHGSFIATSNGQLVIKGNYLNGKAVGKWEYYQWKDGTSSKLVPKLMFTIAENPQPYTGTFYHRRNAKKPSLGIMSYGVGYSSSHVSGSGHNPQYSLSDEFPVELRHLAPEEYSVTPMSTYYEFVNCLKESTKNNQENFEVDYFNQADVDLSVLEDSCGVIFPLEDLRIYFKNGQEFLHYDFTKPEKLFSDPIYFENGKIQNQIVKTKVDNIFEESWFDEKGKLLQKNKCNAKGDILLQLYPATHLNYKGKSYAKYDNHWSTYYQINVPQNLNEEIVYYESLNEDLKPICIETYVPLERKGKITRKSNGHSSLAEYIQYELNPDYTAVHIKDSIVLGKLWIKHDTTIVFAADGYIQFVRPKNSTDSINTHFLSNVIQPYISIKTVHLGKEFFTGKIVIQINDDGTFRFSQKNNEVILQIDRTEFRTIEPFINSVAPNRIIFDILPPKETWQDENEENEQTKALKSFALNNCELEFEHGKLIHSELIAKNSFPLQSVDCKLGISKTYNHYPAIGFRYTDYRDSVYSFLSEETTFGRKETHRLIINEKGDTTHAEFYNEDSNVVNYQARTTATTLTKWTTKNDTIVAYEKVDTKKNQLQTYIPERNSIELLHQDGYNEIVIYLSKNYLEDSIFYYDTLNRLAKILYVNNGKPRELLFYEGSHDRTLEFDSLSGWKYMSRDRTFDRYAIDEIGSNRFERLAMYNSINSKKHDFRGNLLETGKLVDNEKKGLWHYYYPKTIGHYTVLFEDTTANSNSFHKLIMSDYYSLRDVDKTIPARKATISFFDTKSNLKSQGILYEYDNEYSCLQNNYTEQYIIEYTLYNGKPTLGTMRNVVNYYPNGNKMNEGTLVDGKPEGFWKWYHNDGSLYQMGKYKNGMREGRWLKGDLSKVRFTGEMCLDPNSEAYKELLNTIYVTVEYYEKGLLTHTENHVLENK